MPWDAHPRDARLRRVEIADGRDPSLPAPIELVWHERVCSRRASGTYVIDVPYLGGPPPAGIDAHLSATLRQRWSRRSGPWTISSVSAEFQRTAKRRGHLKLTLAATPTGSGLSRLDGMAMIFDLRSALQGR